MQHLWGEGEMSGKATLEIMRETKRRLDLCLTAGVSVINFYSSTVSEIYVLLTESVMVGKIEVGRSYKGHLITPGEMGDDPAIFDKGEM